jgi:hypothetical protein
MAKSVGFVELTNALINFVSHSLLLPHGFLQESASFLIVSPELPCHLHVIPQLVDLALGRWLEFEH